MAEGFLSQGLADDANLTKDFPELAAVYKACGEKAKSFENFMTTFVNGPKANFTMTHGDSHER